MRLRYGGYPVLRGTDGHGRYKDEHAGQEKGRCEKSAQEGEKSGGETQEKCGVCEEGFRYQEEGSGEKGKGEETGGQGQEEIAILFSGAPYTGHTREPRFSLFGRGAGFF